jgi:hypothetical protein
MKNVKSRTRTLLTDEHWEGCMQITTGNEFDIERLMNQKQCKISHKNRYSKTSLIRCQLIQNTVQFEVSLVPWS